MAQASALNYSQRQSRPPTMGGKGQALRRAKQEIQAMETRLAELIRENEDLRSHFSSAESTPNVGVADDGWGETK